MNRSAAVLLLGKLLSVGLQPVSVGAQSYPELTQAAALHRIAYDEARDQLVMFGTSTTMRPRAWATGAGWGPLGADVVLGASWADWFPPLDRLVARSGNDLLAWDGADMQLLTALPADGELVVDRTGGQVLLIRKKRGLGAGKINGPGGKLDPGETFAQTAVREVQEVQDHP